MSVAFRRESDEAHLEPRFELPIPSGPNLVTPRGLLLVRARTAELEQQVAAEKDADRLTVLQRDLRYWRTRQATAELAPIPTSGEAAFGSRITIRMNGRERRLDIVGDDEADPDAGRIAFTAPLARALIGAETGDLLPFAGREDAIQVMTVAIIPAAEV